MSFTPGTINEKFEIPSSAKVLLEALSKYITGYNVIEHIKYSIKNIKTKTYLEKIELMMMHKIAQQYISDGKRQFRLSKKETEESNTGNGWLAYGIKFIPINHRVEKTLPAFFFKRSFVEDFKRFTNGEYVPRKNTIFIRINAEMDTNTVADVEELRRSVLDTLAHEYRHFLQFTSSIKTFGLGKRKILKNPDYIGATGKDLDSYSMVRQHSLRPLEFKTNIYSFAKTIVEFLTKNFKRSDWAAGFKTFLTKDLTNSYNYRGLNDEMKHVNRQLRVVIRLNDTELYKQYVKEIYKIIFHS